MILKDKKELKRFFVNLIRATALDSGNFNAFSLFLDYGADIESKDTYGRTALLYAIYELFSSDLPSLLKDVSNDYYKKSCLQSISFIRFLLEKGANPNAQDNNGNTSLHYVKDRPTLYKNSKYWNTTEKIKIIETYEKTVKDLLKKHKADPLIKNKKGLNSVGDLTLGERLQGGSYLK